MLQGDTNYLSETIFFPAFIVFCLFFFFAFFQKCLYVFILCRFVNENFPSASFALFSCPFHCTFLYRLINPFIQPFIEHAFRAGHRD